MTVLTLSVVAGFTAGCSSAAEAPTTPAKSTTNTQPTTKAPAVKAVAPVAPKPGAGKFAYCAPLAVADAFEEKMSSQTTTPADAGKQLVKLLEPAVAAATADGKTDVAAFLDLLKTISADPMNMTAQQRTAAETGMTKLSPVILKDCGINMQT